MFFTRLEVVLAQYIKAKCSVENEDVVRAALTDDFPTTSEWSTISLPTQVRLILETWRYVLSHPIFPISFNVTSLALWQPYIRADAMFAPSQWETVSLCNDVSHWLGASLAINDCHSASEATLTDLSTLIICTVNSLRPSDSIWRQWSWTTLAQVMACCLMAPSHYLNQCWLTISKVLWQLPEGYFKGNTPFINW